HKMKLSRNHILRQCRCGGLTQPLFLFRLSLEKYFNAAAATRCDRPSYGDHSVQAGDLSNDSFDFAQLYTVAQHFYLEVSSAQVGQRTISNRAADAVSRAIINV